MLYCQPGRAEAQIYPLYFPSHYAQHKAVRHGPMLTALIDLAPAGSFNLPAALELQSHGTTGLLHPPPSTPTPTRSLSLDFNWSDQ